MIDASNIPPVAGEELLARFITQTNQFRSSDQTVKPDLIVPFRLTELSVTRHRDATIEELWRVGSEVAALRQQTLHRRSDVQSSDCISGPLSVMADPILPPQEPFNPNHANIVGFPSAKPDQKAWAIKIALKATKRITPPQMILS